MSLSYSRTESQKICKEEWLKCVFSTPTGDACFSTVQHWGCFVNSYLEQCLWWCQCMWRLYCGWESNAGTPMADWSDIFDGNRMHVWSRIDHAKNNCWSFGEYFFSVSLIGSYCFYHCYTLCVVSVKAFLLHFAKILYLKWKCPVKKCWHLVCTWVVLKALDIFGSSQRSVFSLGVFQHMHKITNLWKI